MTIGALQVLSEWLGCNHDATIAVDRDTRVIYWNHAAESLFGLEARKALGREYKAATCTVLPEEKATVVQAEVVKNGRWKGVITCVDANRKRRIVDVAFSALTDKNGLLQASVGIHREIADRRQREDPLRITERRSKLAHNGLGLGVWETGPENRRIQVVERPIQDLRNRRPARKA